METRANFVAIGAFTLAVVAGAFLFVLWMVGYGGGSLAHYRVVFQGSVSGLARGGVVLFNGLRVGEVKAVDFLAHDPGRVAAEIEVDSRIPVRADTIARLEMQGLTGASAVALTGGAPDAKPLSGDPPTLTAEPSQIQNLLVNVQNISTKADSVLSRADKLMAENSAAISDTMKNIDNFSKALGDASSGLPGMVSGIGEIGRKIGPLAGRLEKLTDTADNLLSAVDAAKVKKSVNDLNAFTSSLGDKDGPTQRALADAATLVKRLNDTLADVDGVVKAFDAKKVGSLMDSADAVGRTLADNRENLDRTLKDAAEIAEKLKDSADKVDGLMTAATGFLGSGDTKGPLSQVGDAAKSIKSLADEVNLRVRQMSSGLVKFSGAGLTEYQGMAVDARKTLNDLDRVILSIEKHPTQLIFGAKNP